MPTKNRGAACRLCAVCTSKAMLVTTKNTYAARSSRFESAYTGPVNSAMATSDTTKNGNTMRSMSICLMRPAKRFMNASAANAPARMNAAMPPNSSGSPGSCVTEPAPRPNTMP